MSKNGRPESAGFPVSDGVPIIGESVWMGCPRGHVQHLRQPFTIGVGAEKPLMICGMCWLNFVAMFSASPLEPEEVAELQTRLGQEGG